MKKEALLAVNNIGKRDSHIKNDALNIIAKLKSRAKT